MSKTFLIVGASTGIGLELTKILANEGHQVHAVARNPRELENLDHVNFIPFDVLSDEAFRLDLETLDGYAYCPGTINLKPFHRLKKEDFLHDFGVNVLGGVQILLSVVFWIRWLEVSV